MQHPTSQQQCANICDFHKDTFRRSALRITRESELLGSQLTAYHTREALVIEANFLRSDLPYFAELLGEVITQTKYTSQHARISSLPGS